MTLITKGGIGFNIITYYLAEYQTLLDFAEAESTPLPNEVQRKRDSRCYSVAKNMGLMEESDVFWKAMSNGSYDHKFAQLNWKDPTQFRITEPVPPTFDANGWTGNGIDQYLTSDWIPATHGVKYTLNNAGVLYYTNSGNLGNLLYIIGANNASVNNRLLIRPKTGVNVATNDINSNTATNFTNYNDPLYEGFGNVGRLTSGHVKLFKDGNDEGTTARASANLCTVNIALLSRNDNGTIVNFSSLNVGFLSLGANVTGLEPAASTWFNNTILKWQ